MRQFLNILRFELAVYFKNKTFVVTTALLILIVGIVLFFPRFSQKLDAPSTSDGTSITAVTDTTQESSKPNIMLIDQAFDNSDATLSYFQSNMIDKHFVLSEESVETARTLINDGAYESAIILTSPTEYTYITKNLGLSENQTYRISEILKTKYRLDSLVLEGIQEDKAIEIIAAPITNEVIVTGKDQQQNFLYTYVLIMTLYMAIIIYGQLVATSVATEKSSRAMEVLITSAKPTNLIFGKVIGAGLAGLFQLVAIFGSSFIFFNMNKSYWGDAAMINSLFNMPLSILLYTILFFILGYFIYSFLYGAIGSLVSKVEEINTLIMPVMLLFIAAFMIVMNALATGNVDTTLMLVASYIPFTSPMAMFTRICMGEVAMYEIIISVIILIISTFGIGYMSAKIYQMGVLMYGKPPKLSSIFKALRHK